MDIAAGLILGGCGCGRVQFHGCDFDHQPAAVGHGIAGVAAGS
jgi:hypothetical protein